MEIMRRTGNQSRWCGACDSLPVRCKPSTG